MSERYQRQILLKEIGVAGQQKLAAASILVVGAGGLGCPALLYLAGAGIGVLAVADGDEVQLSNLHRQLLYSVNDIGNNKAASAVQRLQQINPEIQLQAYPETVTVHNALEMFAAYDIIIDGTDNFASRYLINDACVILRKPLVYGAVAKFEGQVSVFNYPVGQGEISVNYRDLFSEPPAQNEVKTCDQSGVLGVLPGIIGTMQATEAIKLITGLGQPLANRLLNYNVLTNRFYEIRLKRSEQQPLGIPVSAAAFRQMNYPALCGEALAGMEISIEMFAGMIGEKNVEVIDVRESHESPKPYGFNYRNIPAGEIIEQATCIKSKTIVLFCQSGKRSLEAAQKLQTALGGSAKVYSIAGGIAGWQKIKQRSDGGKKG